MNKRNVQQICKIRTIASLEPGNNPAIEKPQFKIASYFVIPLRMAHRNDVTLRRNNGPSNFSLYIAISSGERARGEFIIGNFSQLSRFCL